MVQLTSKILLQTYVEHDVVRTGLIHMGAPLHWPFVKGRIQNVEIVDSSTFRVDREALGNLVVGFECGAEREVCSKWLGKCRWSHNFNKAREKGGNQENNVIRTAVSSGNIQEAQPNFC
ncbi:hypothetical protein V6N11_012480 [Hibiscus sabdariffa]|uniref:Uncharacterized protein n=1 Tax=Hibiscus sabdariffa TaxID=183260 RepID=A0ABR2QB92_9ROSI